MDLHGIVSGVIGAVNPLVPIVIKRSAGSTTAPDGHRTPVYAPVITIMGQVQPLGYTDIITLDGLQIQGLRRKIYVSGDIEGIVRVDKTGGDLVTFPDATVPAGTIWKAVLVLEKWPDWCSVAVTLQNSPT